MYKWREQISHIEEFQIIVPSKQWGLTPASHFGLHVVAAFQGKRDRRGRESHFTVEKPKAQPQPSGTVTPTAVSHVDRMFPATMSPEGARSLVSLPKPITLV